MTGSESSDVIELDDLTTGLTTDAELEPDDGVKALRVTWIAWDSDFRTTDLRIGDRIVAVDGVSLHEQLLPGRFGNLIGQATEALGSPEHPATSGQQIVLTVMRAGERSTSPAGWCRERLYRRGEESALAPGGPVRLENDGFDGAWMGWYENFVKRMSYVLDDGWVRAAFDNRAALVEHDDWLPRVSTSRRTIPASSPGVSAPTGRPCAPASPAPPSTTSTPSTGNWARRAWQPSPTPRRRRTGSCSRGVR